MSEMKISQFLIRSLQDGAWPGKIQKCQKCDIITVRYILLIEDIIILLIYVFVFI